MKPTKLLILSDFPTAPTGLARITRELAERISYQMHDVFTVGVCGYGGTTSGSLPYMQYPVQRQLDMSIPQLPAVWNDFVGDDEGILLCIWNAAWLDWLVNPSVLPDGQLKSFLKQAKMKKWLYAPIDAEGPKGRLPRSQKDIFNGFDRVLAYTDFGAQVIAETIGKPVEHLPHGMAGAFHPRSREEAREGEFLRHVCKSEGKLGTERLLLLSAVATNTPRKDWGLCFETCAELLRRGENVGLWAHTDQFYKAGAWDLTMLASEFGMTDRTIFTNAHLSDVDMAWGYAGCDVALSIGSGEGWGYTAAEALACGIPAIHGDYAGSTEFIPPEFLVEPAAFRMDGYYGNRRPVFRSEDWANKIMQSHGLKAKLDDKFYWPNCFPRWMKWLKEGL